MIEINLLPSGTTRRPAQTRVPGAGGGLPRLGADPRVAALGGVALLLGLWAGYWFWTSGQARAELDSQVSAAAADSVRLERAIALMKTLDTRRDTISRKMDVIRQVDTRRYVWPHVLDEVSRATPPFMWLTRLAAVEDESPAPPPPPAPAKGKGKGKARGDTAAAPPPPAPAPPPGPVFNLEGNAGNTEALTRFMKNLESSPMIRDVSLITSQQEVVQGRTVFKFTLEARWEEPDSAFVETVPLLTTR